MGKMKIEFKTISLSERSGKPYRLFPKSKYNNKNLNSLTPPRLISPLALSLGELK